MKTILFINLRSHKVERIQPLIEAKELGYKVVLVTDKNPNLVSNYLDEIIYTDTYNTDQTLEKVLTYAKENKIDGVCTWSDKDVELVSIIAETLKLPGINPQIVKNARNKYDMRLAFSKVEGISPKFGKVNNEKILNELVKEIGMPGILKPVGASGSKGIFKIENSENLNETYNTLLNATSPTKDKVYSYYPNEYIYEEYLEGNEVSVEGLVQNNKVFIVGITDKDVTNTFSLEYIAIFPSSKNKEIKEEIKEKAKLAIKSLGINNCAFHLEGRVTKKGFKVIECAARPGGGFITSHLIKMSSGHSFIKRILKMSTGEDISEDWPNFEQGEKKACFYSLMAKRDGIFKSIDGLDSLIEIPGVKHVIPLKKYGDKITMPPKHFSNCFLINILIEGKSDEDINEKIEKINHLVEVVIE
ncbi:phosphoribosylglycinamide synthetase [Staphylococcus devriesei]|nr:phosphoribosylglycinamide synthetase [Staphylococcus devriesei]